MRKTRLRFATLALGLLAAACQDPTSPSIHLDKLLSAPLTVDIGGRAYRLETFVCRDFMPPTNLEGSTLVAVVYLTADDGLPFPDEIGAPKLWVVQGEEVWEAAFGYEERPRSLLRLDQVTKIASGGPRWDVGSEVEVIVLITESSRNPRLLRATKQIIARTE
jgi:hypothetical protein